MDPVLQMFVRSWGNTFKSKERLLIQFYANWLAWYGMELPSDFSLEDLRSKYLEFLMEHEQDRPEQEELVRRESATVRMARIYGVWLIVLTTLIPGSLTLLIAYQARPEEWLAPLNLFLLAGVAYFVFLGLAMVGQLLVGFATAWLESQRQQEGLWLPSRIDSSRDHRVPVSTLIFAITFYACMLAGLLLALHRMWTATLIVTLVFCLVFNLPLLQKGRRRRGKAAMSKPPVEAVAESISSDPTAPAAAKDSGADGIQCDRSAPLAVPGPDKAAAPAKKEFHWTPRRLKRRRPNWVAIGLYSLLVVVTVLIYLWKSRVRP
ncbi:MAG: hypothetical protein AB7K24_28845 [Gemmataceae bacterium]